MKKIDTKTGFEKIVDIVTQFFSNYAGLYSTQAAFYFIVSAVPLLMFLLSLIQYVYPVNLRQIIDIINVNIPDPISYYVIRVVREIYEGSSLSLISITAITTLWAGSKSIYALSQGLKTIYKTNPTNMSAKITIRVRVVSLIDTLLMIFLLIFSIVFLLFDRVITNVINTITPQGLEMIPRLIKMTNIYSILVITIVFLLIYKVFSKSSIPLRHHFPGAILAAFAWVMFSTLFSLYFNTFPNFSIMYGALAAIVFMMLWLKTCMMILLMGAQINMYLYENKRSY